MHLLKCNYLPRAVVFLAFSLFCAPPVAAQILNARPIDKIAEAALPEVKARAGVRAWPAVARPLSRRLLNQQDTDRGVQYLTEFIFPAAILTFDNASLEDWMPKEKPSRYAYEWSYRWAPEVTCGVAQLPANTLPAPIKHAAWDKFILTLRQQYGARLRLRCNDNSEANPDMIRPLFGAKTHVLEFDVMPLLPEEPITRIIQVFMEAPQGVIVAGCEGPVAGVEATRRSLSRNLIRLGARLPR